MKNYIKIPICAIAVVTAGLGGIKAYSSSIEPNYMSNASLLNAENVSAYGDNFQILTIPPVILELAKKFGEAVIRYFIEKMAEYTIDEIVEQIKELYEVATHTHLAMADTGETQTKTIRIINPLTNSVQIKAYIIHKYKCQHVKGQGTDDCEEGYEVWL